MIVRVDSAQDVGGNEEIGVNQANDEDWPQQDNSPPFNGNSSARREHANTLLN